MIVSMPSEITVINEAIQKSNSRTNLARRRMAQKCVLDQESSELGDSQL